jgi:predicted anti-sigma-YlaC factor YlaD
VGRGEGAEGVSDGQIQPEEKKKDAHHRWRPWVLVVVLVVVPGALYSALPAVAFLPLTTAQKVGLSAGLVVLAEAVFWGAALFLGKEVISRYRGYFDPRAWKR